MYDIVIIGAGPAGMTAAIYASQARKKILILEKKIYGGQILKADKIKNYPGFLEISGIEFANNLYNQVKNLNIEVKFEEVIKVNDKKEFKEITTKKETYKSKTIIIATGATSRKLGLSNEDKLIGKGISYCATCDGMFFKNKDVAIYGGGNSAIDEALYLSDICNKVYVIYRNKEFKLNTVNLSILKEKNNVEFILNSNIIDIKGKNKLESIILRDNDNLKFSELIVDGLFIAIGRIPVSDICSNLISINEKGYIISNNECITNIDGIFVAGDIREKQVRQLTTACSDGTIAAINAIKHINKKA